MKTSGYDGKFMKIVFDFRPYISTDFAKLLDLLYICYRYDQAGWVFDPDTLRNILLQDDFIPLEKRIWLVWHEEQLVGFLRLSSEQRSDCIIMSCFGTVHPEFRRHGLGTEMFHLAKRISGEIVPEGLNISIRIPARKSVEGIYQYCEKLGLSILKQFSVLKLCNEVRLNQPAFPPGIMLRSFDPQKDVAEYQKVFELVFPQNFLCSETLKCELELPGFDPNNWLMLVNEKTGRIIGFCITTLDYEIDESIGLIEYLGIHPDFQNQGYGKNLLISAVNHLRSKNVSWIKVATEVRNNRALKLYYEIGFEGWKESRLYNMDLS
jgi:mycothiol synthase